MYVGIVAVPVVLRRIVRVRYCPCAPYREESAHIDTRQAGEDMWCAAEVPFSVCATPQVLTIRPEPSVGIAMRAATFVKTLDTVLSKL